MATRKSRASNGSSAANGTDKNRVMAVLSDIVRRSTFARKAGFQYGGKRDVFKAAGYPPQEEIQFEDYWSMYKRNEIASRIIELPAKTTWREPPEVKEASHDEEGERGKLGKEDKDRKAKEKIATQEKAEKDQTAFEHEFVELAERLKLWHFLTRSDVITGIGRYSVLLFVVKGHTDDMLKTPLTRVRGPEDISTLVPYSEGNARIAEWDYTPGPNFGKPLSYDIRLFGDSVGPKGGSKTIRVHWTRVLHFAENKVEDEAFGTPRIERVFNRLFDLDKIAASVGETYWQAAGSRILQATLDENAEATDAVLNNLEDQMAEIVHDLRRQFISKGAKLDWISGDVVPVKDIGDFYFSLIAVGAGIPKRIIFGNELGELASTTDQETFFGTISERQHQYAEPDMLRPFIQKMIDLGALPAPTAGEYEVAWKPLYKESAKEIAEANTKNANAAASLVGVGGDPLSVVEIDDDRRVLLVPRAPGTPGDPFASLMPDGVDLELDEEEERGGAPQGEEEVEEEEESGEEE